MHACVRACVGVHECVCSVHIEVVIYTYIYIYDPVCWCRYVCQYLCLCICLYVCMYICICSVSKGFVYVLLTYVHNYVSILCI